MRSQAEAAAAADAPLPPPFPSLAARAAGAGGDAPPSAARTRLRAKLRSRAGARTSARVPIDADDVQDMLQGLLDADDQAAFCEACRENKARIPRTGPTLMRMAVVAGAVDAVSCLLNLGVDANATAQPDHRAPLNLVITLAAGAGAGGARARARGRDMLAVLLAHGGRIFPRAPAIDDSPLFLAVRLNQPWAFPCFLNEKVFPAPLVGQLAAKLLHFAAQENCARLFRSAHSLGLDLDQVAAFPDGGCTAMLTAVSFGSTDCVRTLLELGASPDAAPPVPVGTPSPLCAAVRHDREVELLLLLAAGAHPDGRQPGFDSALHRAAFGGQLLLAMHLSAKAELALRTEDSGLTAPELADAAGHPHLAALLRGLCPHCERRDCGARDRMVCGHRMCRRCRAKYRDLGMPAVCIICLGHPPLDGEPQREA